MTLPVSEHAEVVGPWEAAEHIFGVELWEKPREILEAVWEPHAVVAVKSCHSSGKTHVAAVAACLAMYEGWDVITTAPGWIQVEQLLWGQLKRLIEQGVIAKKAWGKINKTEIVTADGSIVLGMSTNESVRFQGFHARPGSAMLIVFDEALGVKSAIYEAIEGVRASGDVRWLLIGNPTVPAGEFYEMFRRRRRGVRLITIDAFDTPNLRGVSLEDLAGWADDDPRFDGDPVPYLVTRRWVRDMYDRYGEKKAAWLGRVRAEFPESAEDMLFSLGDVEAAEGRVWGWVEGGGPVVMGLDVAGPGNDETVLTVGQEQGCGLAVCEQVGWPEGDVFGPVMAAIRRWVGRGLVRVSVDVTGVGWHLYVQVRDECAQWRAVEVVAENFGASADEGGRFQNRKAEGYVRLAERFRAGEVGGIEEVVRDQLLTVRYRENRRGLVEIVSKEEMAREGVGSPDYADSLMLCGLSTRRVVEVARAVLVGAEGAVVGGDGRLYYDGGDRVVREHLERMDAAIGVGLRAARPEVGWRG